MSHDWGDDVLVRSLQRSKQLIIWWCENQTVEWVQQHHSSKICDDIFGANTAVFTSTVTGNTIQKFFLFDRGHPVV